HGRVAAFFGRNLRTTRQERRPTRGTEHRSRPIASGLSRPNPEVLPEAFGEMTAAIIFEFPFGWLSGLPLAAALVFMTCAQRRRGVNLSRVLTLAWLRVLALVPLVFLAARPVWVAKEPPAPASRGVALLLDRSESMSLEENDSTRYQQALDFLRR